MDALPTGTVTFLFTDIEGSTKLLEEHGERYPELLAEHRRVLRDVFGRNGGVEVDTQGDAFFVAFARASDALVTAEDAQRALELPVRMGIHTGEPQLADGGYVGIDVHRAARICSAAHGRQVVVSQRTVELADGAQLADLGLHRLKDLGEPVNLFQLGDEKFPPLRSLNASNLPAQPSPLVGRDHELEELLELVESSRLVTLTGAGGSGKTRLALQVAAEAVDQFRDGVFWTPLAAIVDPDLVLPAVAQALGAKVPLPEHVDEKRMLLLLDNLEQVIEAAPHLATLLERCPNLHLLVTSRTLLRIAGERDYQVDPLPEDDAVALFRERAAVSEPLEAVREICRRLDGLPLAIELAAARTRLLPPDQLLVRLERALPVLTGGRRDAPQRQRTLRSTIEWSYDLLEPEEQQLFRRLGAFPGSFTVEAAEQVCGGDVDTLEALLEKSLLRSWESGRLGMLETIRELAVELLEASPEADELRRRHANHFLALAKDASLSVDAMYAGGVERHELVVPEQANLRAALDWAAGGDSQLGLELAVSLEQFWVMQSPIEGKRRLEALLARPSAAPPDLLARAHRVLAGTSWFAGDWEAGHRANARALELFREAGDALGETTMLFRVGTGCVMSEEDEEARQLLGQSLEGFRRLGIPMGECEALGNLGSLELLRGDRDRGRALIDESIAIAAEIGWRWWEASKQFDLAEYWLKQGDVAAARPLLRRGLELYRDTEDRIGEVFGLGVVAWAAALEGDASRAGRLWGAIEAEEARAPLGIWEAEYRDRYAAELACVRGEEFEAGLSAGREMPLDQAVEEALANV